MHGSDTGFPARDENGLVQTLAAVLCKVSHEIYPKTSASPAFVDSTTNTAIPQLARVPCHTQVKAKMGTSELTPDGAQQKLKIMLAIFLRLRPSLQWLLVSQAAQHTSALLRSTLRSPFLCV